MNKCLQITSRKGESKPAGPKITKMPNLPDYQFYDTAAITKFYKKQEAYELHQHARQQREANMRHQGASEEVIAKEMALKGDEPQPLTEEEIKERDDLLKGGYSNWNRKDFSAFVRACERHGRNNLTEIAKEIEGKTEDEVRQYAAVFFERGPSHLNDAERIFKNIERGEQRIQRQAAIMKAIARKLDSCKNPWQELKLSYGPAKGKTYTEEEDRFLICMVHKLGYGAWDELKAEIRNSWRFRFDWFFKSRTPQELARRCETLIRLIEKENEEDEERSTGPKKRGGRRKTSDMKEGSVAPDSAAQTTMEEDDEEDGGLDDAEDASKAEGLHGKRRRASSSGPSANPKKIKS